MSAEPFDKYPWWGELSIKEKRMYLKYPAYVQLREYVESNGDETKLENCTFRWIHQLWHKTMNVSPHSLWRVTVAYSDWKLEKLDGFVLGPLEDQGDTIGLAKVLLECNVLHRDFPHNYRDLPDIEEEEEEDEGVLV